MITRLQQAAAVAAFSIAAISGAFALNSPDNDAFSIADAKTSLIQAVTAAERYVGGKASKAEYERHQNQWIFEVEVVNGNKVMDVKVDPVSGQVLAATEDKADYEDEKNQGEHEEERAD